MPDLLDWQITDAPSPDETPITGVPPMGAHPAVRPGGHHLRRLSRWVWVMLGGVTLTVVLGLLVFSWGNQRRATADVRNTFLAEENAARTGDTNALTRLTAAGYADWLDTRLALARHNVAAPAPAWLFTPSPQAGDIISLTTFAPDIMQADLVRAFIEPGGETLRFVTTQFYQYQNGWKRTPTPPYFSGELRQFEGRRLTILHYERDAGLINELGPYFNDLLESACGEWNCADNFNIALQFVDATPAFEPDPATGPAPLTLKLLAHANTAWLDASPLNLPTPHIIGAPADEASQAVFQRALAQQVLLYAAQRFTAEGDGPTRNALAYALFARLAVRLNLDSPAALTITQTALMTDIQALWNLRATPVWEQRDQRQLALQSALAVLNVLLEDQPIAVEQELFRQLRRYNNPRSWLAHGLGMEYADVQTWLAKAGDAALSVHLSLEAEPTLALQCASGPQLYFESENATRPFISGLFFDAQISGWPWLSTGNSVWSPDGNYLVLNVSGQPAVLDLSTSSLTWLNISENESTLLPRGWISDTTLVYLAQSELHFLDVTQPRRQFPVYVAVNDYILAPDGTRAAVVWEQPDGQGNGQIALMPATGGPLITFDFGASPVWTADGSALIFIQHEEYQTGDTWQTRSSIKRADIVTGIRYIVQKDDSILSLASRYNTTLGDIWDINQLRTYQIRPGQVLVIPTAESNEFVVVPRELYVFSADAPNFLPEIRASYLTGSPTGQTLALVVGAQVGEPYQLLLIKIDGSSSVEITTLADTGFGNPERFLRTNPDEERIQLVLSQTSQFVLPPRFSADGRYLTVVIEENGQPVLKVYAVAGPRLVLELSNATSFAWSATGHRLAITTNDGTFIVADGFRTTDGSNKVVTHEVCNGVWWRP